MSEDEPSDVVGHDLRGCIPVEVRASPASQPIGSPWPPAMGTAARDRRGRAGGGRRQSDCRTSVRSG